MSIRNRKWTYIRVLWFTSILTILNSISPIPPIGTRSLPVTNSSNFFLRSSEKDRTTSQKYLQCASYGMLVKRHNSKNVQRIRLECLDNPHLVRQKKPFLLILIHVTLLFIPIPISSYSYSIHFPNTFIFDSRVCDDLRTANLRKELNQHALHALLHLVQQTRESAGPSDYTGAFINALSC